MQSFKNLLIQKMTISQELLKTIRTIGEYKGKEDLFRQQSPQTLQTLRQTAVIQSTQSSNRIEGITIQDPKRLSALIAKKTTPKNRSEQEIAGYRDVLNSIHGSYDAIPFTLNIVLQFHRDLFKYTIEQGGTWKPADNEIAEFDATTGEKTLRFKPVPAYLTANSMTILHDLYSSNIKGKDSVEPLLAISAYILDFLCIHPFRDGNGRMARLLTLLLLYQCGYSVGRFVSLEKIIEETKTSYYDSVHESSQSWHEGRHDLVPWCNYFLGVVLLKAYRDFEQRMGFIENAKGAKASMVLEAIRQLPFEFTISEIVAKCPTVGIDHIRKILRAERDAKQVACLGRGPDAKWKKIAI